MAALIEAAGITKRYGGAWALRNAAFSLERGEVHALVGENGAGKSTLAKIAAGVVAPDSGTLRIDGREVRFSNPLEAQRAGIAIIFQELDLFPQLTVGENIVVRNLRFGERWLARPRAIERFSAPFLEAVGLPVSPRRLLSRLSIGQMQLVAIARALSLEARTIVMDEPTSSLFGDAAERLFGLIGELKRRGVAVVYVSHKMDEIFRVAGRITVLRDGETVGTRAVAETDMNEIVRMMVGRSGVGLETSAAGSVASAPPMFEVISLTNRKLKGVSFAVGRGEVLGIAGLVGAGRSELGRALVGLDRLKGGTLRLNGKPVHPRSSRQAMRSGIALLPEDRKLEGLMMQMPILENGSLAVVGRFAPAGFVQGSRELAAMRPWFDALALRASDWQAPVSALSGGNQQKVLLARFLAADPQVLFLDDPSRGVDIGAKSDIHRIIREFAARGRAVILVSSELTELLACSDRILVLREGRVAASFDRSAATEEKIMAAATIAGAAA
jgi:ABC-type sugar transport system ATPase subunit